MLNIFSGSALNCVDLKLGYSLIFLGIKFYTYGHTFKKFSILIGVLLSLLLLRMLMLILDTPSNSSWNTRINETLPLRIILKLN